MPKMSYNAGPENVDILAKIEEHLQRTEVQGNIRDDALERIQQQLATMNEEDNLKQGERRYDA